MDDKELTVEVQLEESKACYHLANLTKARAALTSARTTANSVYIPPFMQASLDMQSGKIHLLSNLFTQCSSGVNVSQFLSSTCGLVAV